jgi:uncharacterized protein (DUF1330 family)
MTIHDPEALKQYTTLSAPAVKTAGGRYIVAGRLECLEGTCSADRVVLVEFDNAQAARAFYHSPTYQSARQKRLGAAEFRMVLLEGTAAPP